MLPLPASGSPPRLLASLIALLVLGSAAGLHAGSHAPLAAQVVAQEAPQEWERIERRLSVMGTWLRISLEAPTRAEGLVQSERLVRALESTEQRLSTWRPDSELALLNAAPVGERISLSPLLRGELEQCLRLRDLTQGAFDPALAPLVRAWSLREGGTKPTESALALARAASGTRHWSLDEHGMQRLHANAGFEEGGFGKGAGLDAALAAISSAEWRALSIDLGGQLLDARHAETETRSIADPHDRKRAVLAWRTGDGSLATTGNSERGLLIDGESYSHILDPQTGSPTPARGSVTVWARSAMTADCISTACFVMEPDAALAFADAHEGIEVVLLRRGAGGLEARASAGLTGRLTPLVSELELSYTLPAHESAERNTLSPHPLDTSK